MLPIVGAAAIGALAVGSTKALRHYRSTSETLMARLTAPTDIEPVSPAVVKVGQTALTHFTSALTALDDRYQHFLQRRIDTLISGTRHTQWQEITGGEDMLEISPSSLNCHMI